MQQLAGGHLINLKQLTVPMHVRCQQEDVHRRIRGVPSAFQLIFNIPIHRGDACCAGRHINLPVRDENLNRLVTHLFLRNRPEVDVSFAVEDFIAQQVDVVRVQIIDSVTGEPERDTVREFKHGVISLRADDEKPVNPEIAECLRVRRVKLPVFIRICRIHADAGDYADLSNIFIFFDSFLCQPIEDKVMAARWIENLNFINKDVAVHR